MLGKKLNWSSRGWPRVILFTILGTAVCVGAAFAFDAYSFRTGTWRWGTDPVNNLAVPLLVAPPFFFYLLSKQRALAIAHRELMTIASTDGLTSLLNRRAFTEMVNGYLDRIAAAENSEGEGALLVVDVDHFKNVNDSYGHERGDEALKLIAQAIKNAVRQIDLVGRMGGEEFGVFLPGLGTDRAASVAERIRAAVHEVEFVVGDHLHRLSISIGGAVFAGHADFAELYQCADGCLYTAKRSGRDRVELATLDYLDDAALLSASNVSRRAR